MFDDIGGGFVGGQLERVDFSVIEPALTRDLRYELPDLIQVFESGGEGCHRHDCETESRLLVPSKRRLAIKPRGTLEITHGFKGIVKGLEQLGKSCKIQSLFDANRHIDENELAAVIAFAMSLGGQQNAKAGTGHIFKFAHVEGDFKATVIRGLFKRPGKFGRGRTVHATFDLKEVAMFEFLSGNFHCVSSVNWKNPVNTRANYIMFFSRLFAFFRGEIIGSHTDFY
jgi:hypothetical protein